VCLLHHSELESIFKKSLLEQTPTVKIDFERYFRSHTGQKPHSCSECTNSFAQSGALQRQFRVHSGVKPVSCSYCTKSVSESGHLQTYVRIHTGEKPFGCLACTKPFARSDKLQTNTLKGIIQSVLKVPRNETVAILNICTF
jgi:uncharacterized Zn-finger protein